MLVLPSQKVMAQPQRALLTQLREKLDRLEGAQRRFANTAPVCDIIDASLPYSGLPLGCVHELKGASLASAIAFASLLSARIPQKGAILYISPNRSFYPLGLLCGDIKLEQWIHVSARRSKDLAWAVLEALRCPAVMAVLAVMKAADLTFCRRMQLAAESSGATGFLLNDAASPSVASAITRWRISSLKGPSGRGFGEVFWKLELLYCRGGRPGKWPIVWRHGRLEALGPFTEIPTRSIHRIELASETTLAG